LGREFDYYNIPDALSPEAAMDASVFLNGSYDSWNYWVMLTDVHSSDASTRAALHAPTSKDWVEVVPPFAETNASGKPFFELIYSEFKLVQLMSTATQVSFYPYFSCTSSFTRYSPLGIE
jgi:hypothetical protein